jgi:hypothetical protein
MAADELPTRAELTITDVLHATRLVPGELITIIAFGVGLLIGTKIAGKPLSNKVAACIGTLAVLVFLAYTGGQTLGTHTENCDPYGCDEVVDFVPTNTQRERTGLDEFFGIAPPALLGLALGAWPQIIGRSPKPTN